MHWREPRTAAPAHTDGRKKEKPMKAKKTNNPKKNGTLRPWLVDVVVDNLR
jgi:retron-type reverse transcriptase